MSLCQTRGPLGLGLEEALKVTHPPQAGLCSHNVPFQPVSHVAGSRWGVIRVRNLKNQMYRLRTNKDLKEHGFNVQANGLLGTEPQNETDFAIKLRQLRVASGFPTTPWDLT